MTDYAALQAGTERYTRDAAQIQVEVAGVAYAGWLQSEVSRSLENLAGTFSVPVSMVPGHFPAIQRQDEVKVRIGSTVVITGRVLAAAPFYKGADCGFKVTGRDRTGDLVRSTAIYKGGQWRKAKLDRIVKDLAQAYGLAVKVADGVDIGAEIHDFKLSHGETVLDAASRAAKLRGVLVTTDGLGNVLLAKAGTQRFKGAIVRGWNVIDMEDVGTDEERHSEYLVYGQCNTVADFDSARTLKGRAVDPEIKRYMPLVINADGNTTQAELQALAEHTMRVRRGHAYGIRYVVEGWTFEGEAWPVNQRVAVYDDIAGLAGEEWLICSARPKCTLREGDVTELLVRPIEAYDSVPLKSKPKRKNWGNAGNTSNHPGPSDNAR